MTDAEKLRNLEDAARQIITVDVEQWGMAAGDLAGSPLDAATIRRGEAAVELMHATMADG